MLRLQNQILKNYKILVLKLLLHCHCAHMLVAADVFQMLRIFTVVQYYFVTERRNKVVKTLISTTYLMNTVPRESGCWDSLILFHVPLTMLLHIPLYDFAGKQSNLYWALLLSDNVNLLLACALYLAWEGKDSDLIDRFKVLVISSMKLLPRPPNYIFIAQSFPCGQCFIQYTTGYRALKSSTCLRYVESEIASQAHLHQIFTDYAI